MSKCQRCGEEGEDRRTLWMACLYDMAELGVPFAKITIKEGNIDKPFYTLYVCKRCRGEWMTAIRAWFDSKPEPSDANADIPVRVLGSTKMMTREEWEKYLDQGDIDP